MLVAIIGGGGRLGPAVEAAIRRVGAEVVATSRKARDGLVALDVTSRSACLEFFHLRQFDAVVHLAAIADPDLCEINRDLATRINVDGVGHVLEAFGRKGPFIFTSTDYVFDGTAPPYVEDSAPNPINHYGVTKYKAERMVFEIARHPTVLRLPLVYTNDVRDSRNVLCSLVSLVVARKAHRLDNYQVRYPVLADDIASCVVALLDRQAGGVFHASPEEGHTKFGMASEIAHLLGVDISAFIAPRSTAAPLGAVRPRDARLAGDRLRTLIGADAIRPFSSVLGGILSASGYR